MLWWGCALIPVSFLSSLRCSFCSNGYARRYKSCPLCGYPHRHLSSIAAGFGLLALSFGCSLLRRSGGAE